MRGKVHFPNGWSRALFAKSFENQFVIPLPPPRALRRFMELCERVFFSPPRLETLKIDRPVFIVGLPRSGTTLLYNLLCAHERAAYVTTSINSFPTAIGTIEWARKKLRLDVRGERFLEDSVDVDLSSPNEPAMFWGKWIGRDAQALRWDEKRARDFSPEKIREIRTDIRRILLAFGGEGRRFVTKYPVLQTELRMIQDLFPDAHFIHIVRDGRMVANSLVKLHKLCNDQIRKIKHPDLTGLVPYPRVPSLEGLVKEFGADDLRCTANVWQDSIDAVNAVRGDLRDFLEVRYEDILRAPREELGRVFEFAGLSWPSTDWFRREYEGIGRVRHVNQYGGFDTVERIAGRTLDAYGYLVRPLPGTTSP